LVATRGHACIVHSRNDENSFNSYLLYSYHCSNRKPKRSEEKSPFSVVSLMRQAFRITLWDIPMLIVVQMVINIGRLYDTMVMVMMQRDDYHQLLMVNMDKLDRAIEC
jgi:hypothetical protein